MFSRISLFIAALFLSGLLFFADDFLTNRHSDHSFQMTLPPEVSPTFSPMATQIIPVPLDQAVQEVFPESLPYSLPNTSLLFGRFSLQLANIPLSFFQKEYQINGNILFTVYSTTMPDSLSPVEEYNQVLEQIKATAQPIEINKYGTKSFVIRLEEHQQMMYIVVVFENRLLGISCDITDVLRFKNISKVLEKAFPSIL